MTFGEFVGSNFGKFKTFGEALDAFVQSNECSHNETCFGICLTCGAHLSIFAAVNPDKSRYLSAAKAVR